MAKTETKNSASATEIKAEKPKKTSISVTDKGNGKKIEVEFSKEENVYFNVKNKSEKFVKNELLFN